jgi:hypothetical protein
VTNRSATRRGEQPLVGLFGPRRPSLRATLEAVGRRRVLLALTKAPKELVSQLAGLLGDALPYTQRLAIQTSCHCGGEKMRWFMCAVVAFTAAPSYAKSETISLLCGFETVIADTDAKSVRIQEASLEKQTREYKHREFKDGYKHTLFGAQVQDYMSVTDASISYGHDDGPHVNAVHYQIDRHTGILVSSLYNPTTCSLLPVQRMF